jgi:hypothetical protein
MEPARRLRMSLRLFGLTLLIVRTVIVQSRLELQEIDRVELANAIDPAPLLNIPSLLF